MLCAGAEYESQCRLEDTWLAGSDRSNSYQHVSNPVKLLLSSHTGTLGINHTWLHLTHCVYGHALFCLPLLELIYCHHVTILKAIDVDPPPQPSHSRSAEWIQIVRSPFSRSFIWLSLSLPSLSLCIAPSRRTPHSCSFPKRMIEHTSVLLVISSSFIQCRTTQHVWNRAR